MRVAKDGACTITGRIDPITGKWSQIIPSLNDGISYSYLLCIKVLQIQQLSFNAATIYTQVQGSETELCS